MKSVHLVVHVSQLKPTTLNVILNCIQLPPPPVEVDGEPKYKISEILDSKVDQCWKHCKLLYLVHWMGYEATDEETSWLPATELDHASELVISHSEPSQTGPPVNGQTKHIILLFTMKYL
ncbi:hypothetical protein ID866_8654 [Astraeus odoratus]|nr:hypothetical protein ID866_8654 [Astraeus odoratus]